MSWTFYKSDGQALGSPGTGWTFYKSDGSTLALSATAATATLATSVTVSANNSTNETTYPAFVDGATGTQGIETDTGLTYNPSSGTLTSTVFVGALTGNVTGNTSGSAGSATGNAATATALATARAIGGTSFDGTAAIAVALSTEATNITASANNSADETVYPVFVDGVTGTQGIETDTGLTYNPSTGALTATSFTGAVTGTVTGTASEVTVSANNSTDETVYPVFVDGATGSQEVESDTGLTYNPSTGVLTGTQFTGAVSGNATTSTTATTATNVTASANNSADETVYPTFVDGATGGQGIETDTGFTYNPSSGLLTIAGELDAGSLDVSGNADIDGTLEADAITVDGTTLATYIAAVTVTNATTAATATAVTASANNSTDETVYPTFVDGATGGQGIETDTGLTYNPSSGLLTIAGELDAGSLDISGNADIDGTLEADAITVDGTALNTYIASITVTNATTAATGTEVTASANNSTNETVYPAFVDGATGSQGIETDTGFTYNPSSGLLTIAGELDAGSLDISGNADIDGTLETDVLTVGGTNVLTGSLITTLGTISAGVWEGTTVAVDQGGTGATSLTANGAIIGNGSSALTSVDMSTKGGILAGDGSGNPSILAVGSNDQILTADSGETTGLKWATAGGVPSGLMGYFAGSCPTGWSEYTAARGRYVVGTPSGGTGEGTSGTALTNQESRSVGQHNHDITDPAHYHAIVRNNSAGNGPPVQGGAFQTFSGTQTSTATTGITIDNEGSTAGTNAPYIQLTLCEKD